MAQNKLETVIIAGDSYQPEELLIEPGTEVVWQNDDNEPHTVQGDVHGFNSGKIEEGGSWSHIFPDEGTFSYHCEYHPDMTGRVIVEQ